MKVTTQHVVQMVSADELNAVDRQADTARAISLDELSRKLTAAAAESSEPEAKSWMQRLLLVLGGAFAAASAAARMLLG